MKNNNIKQNENLNVTKTALKTNFFASDAFKVFVASLIIPALVSVAFSLLLTIIGTYVYGGENANQINNLLSVKVLKTCVASISFIGIFIYYILKNKFNAFKAIKLNKNISVISVLICVAVPIIAVLGIYPFVNMVNFGLAQAGFTFSEMPFEINSVQNYIIAIFVMALLPALAEELIFRGIIFNGLNNKYKAVFSIGFSAFLFMIMHGSIQQTIFQLIMGVVFCFVLFCTNNVALTFLIHFLSNFVVVSMEYHLAITGATSLTIGTGAMQFVWPIIILIVALAILAALLFALFKHEQSKTKVSLAIFVEKQNFNLKTLTSNEKIYFYVGIIFSSLLWIVNSISGFIV